MTYSDLVTRINLVHFEGFALSVLERNVDCFGKEASGSDFAWSKFVVTAQNLIFASN